MKMMLAKLKLTPCPACGSRRAPMRGPGLQGATPICVNCFMLWYDSGITDGERLGRESRFRRQKGYWPWGDKGNPTLDELRDQGLIE